MSFEPLSASGGRSYGFVMEAVATFVIFGMDRVVSLSAILLRYFTVLFCITYFTSLYFTERRTTRSTFLIIVIPLALIT
jgi:hypothetical protein